MILEDLLHDRDCCLVMLLHHDDSIMDGEGDDTFRPEGYPGHPQEYRTPYGTAAYLSLRSSVGRLRGAFSPLLEDVSDVVP